MFTLHNMLARAEMCQHSRRKHYAYFSRNILFHAILTRRAWHGTKVSDAGLLPNSQWQQCAQGIMKAKVTHLSGAFQSSVPNPRHHACGGRLAGRLWHGPQLCAALVPRCQTHSKHPLRCLLQHLHVLHSDPVLNFVGSRTLLALFAAA
jgi:hypothetical protein